MNPSANTVRTGVSLRFFMHLDARHRGRPLHEWLLEAARAEHAMGGSAFRAIAGFGRHGVLREEAFLELAGREPVMVEFIVDAEAADRLLDRVREAGMPLFFVRGAVQYGQLGKNATA